MRQIEFEILLTLATGERHGYAIIQDIEARSNGALTVETGTLYRALQRLAEEDIVRLTDAPRGLASDDERRRFYAITAEGRRAAASEARRMAALVDAARRASLIPRRS
ncbi:MAG TPA: PadR family transcriptional regulator [Gemmatimonadaceae bacterium]|nr:PadR family transcriptional regulator [Gemmatimonadaceae bacterium]